MGFLSFDFLAGEEGISLVKGTVFLWFLNLEIKAMMLSLVKVVTPTNIVTFTMFVLCGHTCCC